MTREELLQIISDVQQFQSELNDVEVKLAHGGTPKRLYESLSAFSNQPAGGVILLGLDEKQKFDIIGIHDAHRLQENISHLATSDMEPPLRPEFTVEEIDGKTVMAVEIFEIPHEQKPCFYKNAGLQKGSYIRIGNTNRIMNDYEIFGYISTRTQATYDEEPVSDATTEDLDRASLDDYIKKLRKIRPHARYLNQPFEQILLQLKILRKINGNLCPTIAGLLMFGNYPQSFEPQLVITFLQYYGTTETETTPRGERFIDNRKFEGIIPEIVESTVNHIMASIRKSSLIEGLWRKDIPEYPEEAVREAIINAVAHRDYSHFVRGSYIQVRLFADRLEIQSPGGLYGNVTEENIEEEQSTRNRTLMKLMEDINIVENRGSGIKTMIKSLAKANLEPPYFHDKRSSFWVTFKNHTLLNSKAIEWLNQYTSFPLNNRQRLALVYLKHRQQITNSEYQRLNCIDSVTSTKELRSLVKCGLMEQRNTRRWAYYILKTYVKPPEETILEYLKTHDYIKSVECQKLLNITKTQAENRLQYMTSENLLKVKGDRYLLQEDKNTK